MSEPIRLFGAGIVLSSSLTLALNITLTKAPSTFSLSCSTTIAAGVYDLFSFAAKVNSSLRTDIRTKALAAGIDIVPAAASILLKFVFPATWSPTPGANKLSCTFDATGFLEGGVQCTLTVFTLNNTSGWASKLGLARTATTTVTSTVAAPVATIVGTHQPRSIFCFENSTRDSWDNEVRPFNKTLHLANGKKRQWSMGAAEAYREVTLVDLPAEVTGPPLDAMTFSSFGANRSLLSFVDSDESGLTNVSNINSNITLVEGDLVRIGNDDFCSRVTSLSGTQVLTAEAWPSSITPTVGDSIWQISEAHALWLEAYITEYLFVFEPDDSTGQSHFKALAYCLLLDGRVETQFQRRDLYLSLYSVTFSLCRRDTPETVVV
jgi:hypothetical protein